MEFDDFVVPKITARAAVSSIKKFPSIKHFDPVLIRAEHHLLIKLKKNTKYFSFVVPKFTPRVAVPSMKKFPSIPNFFLHKPIPLSKFCYNKIDLFSEISSLCSEKSEWFRKCIKCRKLGKKPSMYY